MQNFFDQFDGPAAAPAAPKAPGFIPGRPKAPTPLQQSAEQRAVEDQAMQARRDAEMREKDAITKERDALKLEGEEARFRATGGVDGTEGENKSAALATKLAGAMQTIKRVAKEEPDAEKPGWMEIGAGIFGSDAKEMVQSERRRNIAGSQFIAVDSALTLATGAAYTPTQIEGYTRSLFPTVSDTPYNVAEKRRKFQEIIETARIQAGAKAPSIDQALAAVEAIYGPANGEADEGENPNVAPGMRQGPTDGLPEDVDPIDVEYIERDPDGKITGYQLNDGSPFVALFDSGNARERDEKVKVVADAQDLREGSAGFGVKADSGLLYGLQDEAQGVGGALSSLLRLENPVEGYQFSRDVARERYNRADEATGIAGDVVEIGAGLFAPAGAAKTVGQGIRTGAAVGTVGGFGYGEGAQGSGVNALLGASLGATVGGAGAKLGNTLANRAGAQAQAAPARNALLQAGAEEFTTVNRAMADPNLQSRVTGVSGTMAGSRGIEKEMGAISDQIKGRVSNLGGKGDALTNETGGAKIRGYAERQIEKSGKAAKRIYDNAEKQAAGVKVTPKESIAVLDNAIADLTETSGLNSAEITFLKTLKDDFSKDLSVGALRRARTTLRKKISKGELTFGESEARVLSVMDAASNDIASGLTAQGKGNAAQLFKKADGLYKERAQYIEGTLQKIIGKRNSNMSDQQVFAKFRSLADPKGDGPAMEKFLLELEPEEVADVAATFAADLGRNGKGDFSTAFLATQAEKLSKNPTALKAIFGEDGARSVNNLIILSKEHARVTNAARGSQTGIRADYRSWLTNAMFTGGATLTTGAAQGAGTAAVVGVATAATVGAAKLAKDAFSARALMSPKVTGWLRSAPRTAEPKAIDAHFKKLAAIAKAEPAIAGDIKSIQDFIFQAANDNQTRAVAGEEKPDRVRPEG